MISPGVTVFPFKSILRVSGPANRNTSVFVPTATIWSALIPRRLASVDSPLPLSARDNYTDRLMLRTVMSQSLVDMISFQLTAINKVSLPSVGRDAQ